jgi:hypothetical protein
MKTIKTRVINVKYLLLINSLLLLFACKREEKLEWNAAMSRPIYYVSEGQHVFYLKEGKIIGSCATLSDIGNFGWAFPQRGRGSTTDILPDSVVVDYGGLNDKNEMCTFRGGMALPTKLIDSLFKVGYVKKGEHENFRNIITGLAPGGRICVWVDHVEIKRGIVEKENVYRKFPSIITDKKSYIADSLEINNYLKHHPIDYKIWEKPDPVYELGFGYCSEDGTINKFAGYLISKEGVSNNFTSYYLDKTVWNKPANKEVNYSGRFYIQLNDLLKKNKIQLPVHLRLVWENSINYSYFTEVVLSQDFKKRFTTPYKHPETGKLTFFHRLVFGVEKDGEHCIIWLDGPGKQEKLMRFKGFLAAKNETNGEERSGYATEVVYY